jgi:hypothetical protein
MGTAAKKAKKSTPGIAQEIPGRPVRDFVFGRPWRAAGFVGVDESWRT